jgi:hypothetical protein
MLLTNVRRHTTSILLSFVAAGFAFLLVELLLMGHTEGSQLVATGASAAGLALSLLALVPQQKLRIGVGALFVVLALSGVYGAQQHQADRGERREEATAAAEAVGVAEVAPAADAAGASEAAPAADAAINGEAGEVVGEALDSFASNPPILSPLALSGLALLGLLVLLTAEAPVALQAAAGQPRTARATGD